MHFTMITKEDLTINIHHIGGIDECGPAEILISLRNNANWILYDADNNSLNDTKTSTKNTIMINKCIGKKDGKTKFYELKNPSASSCLKPSNKTKNMVMDTNEIWGEHTEIKNITEIELHKLSTLIKNKKIPKIDFLSIDTQGTELDIIKGTEEYLDDIKGIICEVEFSELYENQPLFDKTFEYLHKKGFKLVNIFNLQYWKHMDYKEKGYGFLTVGEAFFLRDPEFYFKKIKKGTKNEKIKNIINLIKLAMFGICYNQPEFSKDILNKIKQYQNILNLEELQDNVDLDYLRTLRTLNEDKLTIMIHDIKEFVYGEEK